MLSVEKVERSHDASCPGLYRSLIRRQVAVIQLLPAHVNRSIVPAGLRCSIRGEMLDTSHDFIVMAHVSTLITAYIGSRHL